MVWGGGTVGVPSGLAVDCAGSHPHRVVARLYRGVGRALVQTWVPILGSVESAIMALGALMWRTWWKWGAITLAVVWAIVGGLLGRELGVLQGTAAAIENYQRCLAVPNHNAQACHKSFHKQFARNEQKAHWVLAATVGLSPIAITWLFVWGLVALVRRLRRGFEPTM